MSAVEMRRAEAVALVQRIMEMDYGSDGKPDMVRRWFAISQNYSFLRTHNVTTFTYRDRSRVDAHRVGSQAGRRGRRNGAWS
ncbi:hypothetical protein RKD47_006391 [Streptomyces albogriseolus]